MWHKRLAQDITNKLFDAVLPKGEKALTIDTEFDVQVNEYKEEIKAQMEQGVQAVTEGSLNIKGQFDALIPTLQQFGETVQVAMAKMSSGSGRRSWFRWNRIWRRRVFHRRINDWRKLWWDVFRERKFS